MIYKSTSMKYVAKFQQIYYSQFSTLVLHCIVQPCTMPTTKYNILYTQCNEFYSIAPQPESNLISRIH